MSDFLVCKQCGYRQYDVSTVKSFKKKFAGKGLATHDIPYFCGACVDNASDEDYAWMIVQMAGKSEYVICDRCADIVTHSRIINSLKKKYPNTVDISKAPYRCKCCESVYGKLN
jgi:hypothetical protein